MQNIPYIIRLYKKEDILKLIIVISPKINLYIFQNIQHADGFMCVKFFMERSNEQLF